MPVDFDSLPKGYYTAEFGQIVDTAPPADEEIKRQNLQKINDLNLLVTVLIGEVRLSMRELLRLSSGAVVELGCQAGSPVTLYVNGIIIATGDVIIVNDRYGIRITTIITPEERMKKQSSATF